MTTMMCFMVILSLVAPGFFFWTCGFMFPKKNNQPQTLWVCEYSTQWRVSSADFGRFLFELSSG